MGILPTFIATVTVLSALIGAYWWVENSKLAKRREELAEVAQQNGFLLLPRQSPYKKLVEPVNFEEFQFSKEGHFQKINSVLKKQKEPCDEVLLDYYFEVGSKWTGMRGGSNQVVAIYPALNNTFPKFMIHPKLWAGLIHSIVGFKEIDIQQHKRFAKLYSVTGVDQNHFASFVSSDVLEHLTNNPGLTIESIGHALLITRIFAETQCSPSSPLTAISVSSFFREANELHEVAKLFGI